MVRKANLVLISIGVLSLGFIQFACNLSTSPQPPATIVAVPTAAVPTIASASTELPYTPAAASGLQDIDNILQKAVMGHIAYNAPAAMQVEQTVDIQLLLSPSASPDDLKKQVVETGQVTAAEILVTPLMKAELISEDPQAFGIQPFQDKPEQVVLMDSPTQWRWSVTAKKSGNQVLTLTIFRQVQYNGQMYWRMLETYKNNIHITVNPIQPILHFDWKWLAGILLTAILIPALWRFIDQRNKKKEAAGGAKTQ